VFAFSGGERVAGEQAPQSLGVDPSPVQSGVEAAPATLMRCLEAQMYGRGESVSGEEGVGEFEESVGPAMEAFIERAAEAVETVVGFHDASIMPSPNASRILYMPTELKHKLSKSREKEKHDVALFCPKAEANAREG